ncbi:MAG: anaerobic dehydrogenase, typically selenocysteine-containing [Actinomycetia bacterium]|nr:anaerobic dehydrogenase, typically selenocysteine-containing [Actinomycetes bacterium]
MSERRVVYRTCHLCEATCGLELHLEDDDIALVRGDHDDVFSHGYLCPKGTAIRGLEADPDRIRVPQLRRGDNWFDVSWDDAFAEIDANLTRIIDAHGRDAVALYLGNPNAHNLAGLVYNRVLIQSLRSQNVYSASTVDQMPKQVSAGLMFGAALTIPVPDVDRTDYLLMLGANPFASNGSLMTAADIPGRLRALRERGGRLVVVDPRRTKTAEEASEHLFIRPGTDAHFLMGIVHTLFDDNLVRYGTVAEHLNGAEEVARVALDFAPEVVAPVCGIDALTIRRIANELVAAPTAAVYGRIGTCTHEFGTLASWLVDVINICTGNLDRAGGAMFTRPAVGGANTGGSGGRGRGVKFGRRTSRVRQAPEFYGELPVVCLAEEIETPGDGQVKALLTIAGNPAVSNPDAQRLDRALSTLDFMVSVDIYRNETTRHANVILPPERELARGHYDLALYSLAIRNVANYSPPVIDVGATERPEWQTLLRLSAIVAGQGAGADIDALDDVVVGGLVHKAVGRGGSNVEGRDAEDLLGTLATRRGPERVLDFMLRTGPYGDGFGADPDGLSLAKLEENPHGIDFGALQPRIPDALRTPSGAIELAPETVIADVERLRGAFATNGASPLRLVGRRDLRSNNSWMHNIDVLVKGKERCTVHVHPNDAARTGVVDGALTRVWSATGEVVLPAEVTDAVMPGVVSIPHGWGHDTPGTEMRVAAKHAGTNSNVLASTAVFDPLSGNAVLNGIPVEIAPAVR